MSQYHQESDAAEVERLASTDPRLVSVPVKTRRHPFGLMLLLPVPEHLVVVPIEQVSAPSAPGMLDDVWRAVVVQAETRLGTPRPDWIEISRSELRRSVQMTAVVGNQNGW
jgi:hypothetical protein